MNERRSPPTIYLGNRFLSGDETPRVPLLDRGYLLGDSVFTTLRGYGTRAFALDEHVGRLFEAAGAYGIECPLSPLEIKTRVSEALGRAALSSSAIRITVSRGAGDGGFALFGNETGLISIVIRELGPMASTFTAHISTVRAIPAACLNPKHKVGSYMTNVEARREATANGASEAILLAAGSDAVVSGAASNLFLLMGERLITPSEADGARPGVMRRHLLEVAREHGVATEVRTLHRHELENAEALLFTSSLLELRAAAALNGRHLPHRDHPTVRALTERLRARIEGDLS